MLHCFTFVFNCRSNVNSTSSHLKHEHALLAQTSNPVTTSCWQGRNHNHPPLREVVKLVIVGSKALIKLIANRIDLIINHFLLTSTEEAATVEDDGSCEYENHRN